MKVVIPLFPGFTSLDAVGPYEVLRFLPDAEVVFAAPSAGEVRNDKTQLGIVADAALDDIDRADVVVVPGGPGTRQLLDPEGPYVSWLRRIHETTTWTTSVCSGSLLLGAAGLLAGLEATSHWGVVDILERFGARYTAERVVRQGKIITAAGVSSGIDMALTLAGLIAGDDVARAIQLYIEYDPQPPYDAGSVAKAGPGVLAVVENGFRPLAHAV
jgi:putative intracellular protease/amidase